MALGLEVSIEFPVYPIQAGEYLLQIPIKVFMGAHRFQVNQLYPRIDGVAQQVQLPLTAEFVHMQRGQVAFFLVTNGWIRGNSTNGGVHIRSNVVVQFFILTRKPSRLHDLVRHVRVRGTNGVVSLRGSFIEAKD